MRRPVAGRARRADAALNPRRVSRVCRGALLLAGLVAVGVTATHAETLRTDLTKALVPLDEILPGGPPPDGIPAIDRPAFVAPANAAEWIRPKEPVLALEVNGDARAYPLQILMWHEIVNDTVGGTRSSRRTARSATPGSSSSGPWPARCSTSAPPASSTRATS